MIYDTLIRFRNLTDLYQFSFFSTRLEWCENIRFSFYTHNSYCDDCPRNGYQRLLSRWCLLELRAYGSPNGDTTNMYCSDKSIGGLGIAGGNASPAFHSRVVLFGSSSVESQVPSPLQPHRPGYHLCHNLGLPAEFLRKCLLSDGQLLYNPRWYLL